MEPKKISLFVRNDKLFFDQDDFFKLIEESPQFSLAILPWFRCFR